METYVNGLEGLERAIKMRNIELKELRNQRKEMKSRLLEAMTAYSREKMGKYTRRRLERDLGY